MACDVCIVDKLIEASYTQKRLLDIPEYKYHCPGKRVNGISPPQHEARYVPLWEKGKAHTHFVGFKHFLDLCFLLLCHMPSQGPNAYLNRSGDHPLSLTKQRNKQAETFVRMISLHILNEHSQMILHFFDFLLWRTNNLMFFYLSSKVPFSCALIIFIVSICADSNFFLCLLKRVCKLDTVLPRLE